MKQRVVGTNKNFDLTDKEQAKKANHFSNLQPLWAHENFAKREMERGT